GFLKVDGATILGSSFLTPADGEVGADPAWFIIKPHMGPYKDIASFNRGEFNGIPPELWGVATQDKGKSCGWSTIQCQKLRAVRGGEKLTGAGDVPSQSLHLDKSEANPRHVMCNWIIKVK